MSVIQKINSAMNQLADPVLPFVQEHSEGDSCLTGLKTSRPCDDDDDAFYKVCHYTRTNKYLFIHVTLFRNNSPS